VTVGLEYQIENNKKLESAYQYLINRLDEIHEEYPCRQPEESRTDSYIAYKKFCAREIEIHDELNENSICNNNITNRRKYKAYMKEKKIQEEEYSKKREKTRQIEQLNNPKCIEKY
jgi:hypothetical protein